MSSSSSSNANPFPWGIGWRAFFLGWSAGDRTKFESTMEVCSNFGSMPDMQNKSNAVLMKATKEELKTLIPDPAKGVMAVEIIRWATNQAVSDDATQRKKWCKYKTYWARNDHCAAVYWETAIAPPTVIAGELMTHKCRGFIVAFLISKSVEPNEEQKEMISGFQQGILCKH